MPVNDAQKGAWKNIQNQTRQKDTKQCTEEQPSENKPPQQKVHSFAWFQPLPLSIVYIYIYTNTCNTKDAKE